MERAERADGLTVRHVEKQESSWLFGIVAFWVENWASHTGVGDLYRIRLDAHRELICELGGEGVERRLHRLAGQGEAQPGQLLAPEA